MLGFLFVHTSVSDGSMSNGYIMYALIAAFIVWVISSTLLVYIYEAWNTGKKELFYFLVTTLTTAMTTTVHQ